MRGGGGGGGPPPPPPPRDDLRFSNTTGKKTVWFIIVEVEQETSAPLLKKILDPPLSVETPDFRVEFTAQPVRISLEN